MRYRSIAACVIVTACFAASAVQAQQATAALIETRKEVSSGYRQSGALDARRLEIALSGAEAEARTLRGIDRIRADIEIGTAYRLLSKPAEATSHFEAAAGAAKVAGRNDLAFESWIGVARAQLQASDTGRAALAYESAVEAAGAQPTRKQAHDLAAYGTQLAAGRGELDSALVNALETASLVAEPEDRFYAALELGGVYHDLVASCDYRPIEDIRSRGDDPYGACRRAADASERAYADATAQADGLGWSFIAMHSRRLGQSLHARRMLINLRERERSWRAMGAFAPKRAADVLVNQNFISGGTTDADSSALGDIAEQAAGSADSKSVLAFGLRGDAAVARGDVPASLRFYQQAADLIERDRAGYFDPRRRGTVIERYTSVLVNRALVQLQLGINDEAFAAFETMRSRGLSELSGALASPGITDADRAWLAKLTRVEAQLSAAQNRVVRGAIAEGAGALTDAEARQFAHMRSERSALISDEVRRSRFAAAKYQPASLAQLRAAVQRSGVPVLLYWVTPTNIVGWLEAPGKSRVHSIFLPGSVVADRVRRVRASAAKETAYDAEAARQLYLFLIAPFEADLGNSAQILVIPQGELTDLPFEALIAPDGSYLIESRSVSYATNATFAVAALASEAPPQMRVAAIYDEAVDVLTGDVAAIGRSASVEPAPARTIDAAAAGRVASSAPVLHVLAHGTFDFDEPLLSRLKLGTEVTAADIVGWPLGGTYLAVFSACESGMQGRLQSNELFGFPWALAAAGAHNAVVSRWLLPQAANARWVPAYYAALGRGQVPSAAAAEAARAMLTSGDRHPHGWAAMQVIGH